MNKLPLLGLALGFVTGTLYGLVSAHINLILYPDLPLRYQVSEMLLSTLQSGLSLGALGFLVCVISTSYAGVLAASAFGAAGVVASGTFGGSEKDVIANLLLALYGFLPLVALFIPLNALLRWAANRLGDDELPLRSWGRVRGTIILVALAVLVGVFSAYPREAQLSLARMQQYISTARSADSENVPFMFTDMVAIVKNAGQGYTLEWDEDTGAFPAGNGRENLAAAQMLMTMVTARFETGEAIACLFRSDGALQLCARLQ